MMGSSHNGMFDIIASILLVVVLLLLSAFLSGSETALTAAAKSHIHRLGAQGSRRALLVHRLLQKRESLIGGILIANLFLKTLAVTIATTLFVTDFGMIGVVYAAVIMTFLVVFFTGFLPKTFAVSRADRLALAVAPVITSLIAVLDPLVMSLRKLSSKTLRLFGVTVDAQTNVLTIHDEIRSVVAIHKSDGLILKDHDDGIGGMGDMVGGLLDLDDITLEDVMIHRRNMVTIDAALSAPDIVRQVANSSYTRLPVWRDNPDNIIGILNGKSVLRALDAVDHDVSKISIDSLLTPPWFTPETTTLREQLNAFRTRRAHVALVVDEYGTLMGLVTLEDILEEIVGDIADEHDVAVQGLRKRGDGSVIIEGAAAIRDVNRELEWTLPDDSATTIAGLVLHVAERIPRPGESFTTAGYRLDVIRSQGNRITAVKVLPLVSVAEENVA